MVDVESAHLWQFDSYGKNTDGNDDPRDLQRDLVGDSFTRTSPLTRIKQVQGIRTYDDPNDSGDRSFTDVESFFDDQADNIESGHLARDGRFRRVTKTYENMPNSTTKPPKKA